MSLLENLDIACEITVFPQPNAPGIAVVPPCTQLTARDKVTANNSANDLREKGVEYTLTSEKRVICCQFLRNRSGSPDRPKLHHGMFTCLPLKFGLKNDILNIIRPHQIRNRAVMEC